MSNLMSLKVCLTDNSVALETIDLGVPEELLVIDDGVDAFSMESLNGYIEGVMEGFRDMETLYRLHQVVEKYKTFPTEARQMLYLGIESVTKRYPLNTFERNKVISLESTSSEEALSVAKESVTGTLKAIWDAIVRTMKAIWEKIMSWIGVGSRKLREANNDAKKQKTELEQALKKAETEINRDNTSDKDQNIAELNELKNNIRNNIISDEYLMQAFAFIGREPDFNDIMSNMMRLEELGDRINKLIDAVENASETLRYNFNEVSAADWSLAGSEAEKQTYSFITNDAINVKLKHDIDVVVSKPSDNPSLDAKIIQDLHNFENLTLDVNSIRILDGFTFGGKVFFFRSTDPVDLNYYVLAANKILVDDDKAIVPVLNIEQNLELLNKLEKIQEKTKRIHDNYSRSYAVVQKYHREIIGLVNRLLEATKKASPRKVDYELFDSIRRATKSIMRLAAETAKANSMYLETCFDYTRYSKMCSDENKKQLKALTK